MPRLIEANGFNYKTGVPVPIAMIPEEDSKKKKGRLFVGDALLSLLST
jgi:hypothetical protein